MYDYTIIGSGIFGSTFARLATDDGKKCLVLEKRNHIGGNCYTENVHGIHVHKYGPHIFHTNNEKIWNFVNRFATFNDYKHRPVAKSNGQFYSLPFSMHTFKELWNVDTVEDAKRIIESQIVRIDNPSNLEEYALSTVGHDIYYKLIKDYTIKQWKRDPKELPASIIKRIPIRFDWSTDTFLDTYQGIPIDGYTDMFEKMLDGIEVRTGVNFFDDKENILRNTKKLVYTGKIDEFYDYEHGQLDYRTLKFETSVLDISDFQGTAQVNYCDDVSPWTRIIEHKYFSNTVDTEKTVITREIPSEYHKDDEPFYPINDDTNTEKFNIYRTKADSETNIIFGGRLAEYKYYDMHQVIGSAMSSYQKTNLCYPN